MHITPTLLILATTTLATLAAGCATPEEAAAWLDAGPDQHPKDDIDAHRDPDPTDHGPAPDLGLDLDASPDPDLDAMFDLGLDLDASPDLDPDPDMDFDPDMSVDPDPDPDPDPESWGPCQVDGIPGDCIDIADCQTEAIPGFCPGPAGVQCCLEEAPDPDPDPDPDPNDWGPCNARGTPGTCIPAADCPGRTTPGLCPGPADIQCCTDDDDAFACDPDIYPDPDPNADLIEPIGDPGCPDGMAAIEDFCVDRYEAALLELLPDGTETPHSPYHNPGATPVRAVSLPDAIPQGYIDAHRAAAACNASGKRLCTDAEWLRACRFTDDRTYPYGPARQPGLCNDARARHPAVELFPDAPNPFDHIQDACINQLPDALAPTGSHPECVTPEGLYDLMGNLHEWTADPQGTFRGGFYVDTVRNGNGCLYRTTAHDRSHYDYSTGFRCCADR